MNVLLVSPMPPPEGGIATWTKEYLRHAEEFDIHCTVVNSAIVGGRANYFKGSVNLLDEARRMVSIWGQMRTSLNAERYDIVHINSSCGILGLFREFFCVQIAKRKKCRTVVQFHCCIPDLLRYGFQKRILKKIVKAADHIFVLEEKSYRYIESLGKKGIDLVPNFIEENAVCAAKIYNESLSHILFVGRVEKMKGVYELVECARHFPNIVFDLVGNVNDKDLASQAPSNVVFHGVKDRKEVYEYLIKTDVFLFPSHSEGFSIALLEAMDTGCPVVATNVGANQEMLENQGGIIVRVGNCQDIENAIEQMRSRSLRQKMGKWNRQKVENNYTVTWVMGKIAKLYGREEGTP